MPTRTWMPRRELLRWEIEREEEETERIKQPEPPWYRELWREMPFNPYYWKTPEEQERMREQAFLEGIPPEQLQAQGERAWQATPREWQPTKAYTPDITVGRQPIGEKFLGEWAMPMAALGGIPAAGAVRGALKPAAEAGQIIPKVARAALKPVEVLEKAPALAVKEIAKIPKRMQLFGQLLENKLPHTMGDLLPRQVNKQIKLVANELAEHLGKAPKEIKPITKETLRRGVPQRISDKLSGFVERTNRVERILLRDDNFVEGGKMTQAFWRPVERATNQKLSGIYNTVGEFRNVVKTAGIDLGRFLSEKVTIDGIPLTHFERIGIYLHGRNPDNLVHVVFGNNIPARTMNNVVASLTAEERALASWFYQFYQQQTPLMAQIVKQTTGKPMKIVQDYFPIRLQRAAEAIGELDFNAVLIQESRLRFAARWASSKVRKGFILPRTGKAMQPVELDALQVFSRHLDSVEHYKAFMPVVRDLQRLLNNPTFKRSLVKRDGIAVHQVMEQWLKDVAATDPLRVKSQGEAILRTLRVNTVTAVLGLNITTAMKQFPSFVTGMAEVGELPALKGIFTFLTHPKQTTELLKKYAPQLYKRRFEREIAEAEAMKGLAGRITGRLSLKQCFMILTTTIDRVAVNGLWRGGFDDALKKGLKPEQAAEYATRGIRRTQPYFGVKDIPEYWRSGEFTKALTIFTNQLNQYWNYYRFDILGKARMKEISKLDAARKMVEAFVIPAFMIGAITRSNIPQNAKEVVTDLASMGLATVPILGSWISSAIKGFQSSGLITTELLERLQEFAYNVNKQQWDRALQTIPEMAGYAAGIPVAQPRRTIKALIDLASDKSDDWLELIWGSYTRRQVTEEETPPARKPFKFGGGTKTFRFGGGRKTFRFGR